MCSFIVFISIIYSTIQKKKKKEIWNEKVCPNFRLVLYIKLFVCKNYTAPQKIMDLQGAVNSNLIITENSLAPMEKYLSIKSALCTQWTSSLSQQICPLTECNPCILQLSNRLLYMHECSYSLTASRDLVNDEELKHNVYQNVVELFIFTRVKLYLEKIGHWPCHAHVTYFTTTLDFQDLLLKIHCPLSLSHRQHNTCNLSACLYTEAARFLLRVCAHNVVYTY